MPCEGALSLGSSDDRHKFDFFPAMLFDEINSRHGGASGCQHGIGDNDGALLNGAWKLAVILMRLMGYLSR